MREATRPPLSRPDGCAEEREATAAAREGESWILIWHLSPPSICAPTQTLPPSHPLSHSLFPPPRLGGLTAHCKQLTSVATKRCTYKTRAQAISEFDGCHT